MIKALKDLKNLLKKYNFWPLHLLPLFMIYTGVNTVDFIVLGAYYFTGIFFVVAGYHRYFSHRTFKTSRWFQFVLAFGAMATAQKGVLWWASHHRDHHRYSDTDKDIHSAKLKGFYYSHVGWILAPDYKDTDFNKIKDFAKYPELVWLNKHYWVPPTVVGAAMFLFGGASMLFCSFFLGVVLLWHGTFTINSLAHKWGRQRYETGDESRNSLFLALLTLGEGWHNNHHHYMHSTRQGFFWYEIDIAYYILKAMSWVGLVWDIRGVPDHAKYAHLADDRLQKNKSADAAITDQAA